MLRSLIDEKRTAERQTKLRFTLTKDPLRYSRENPWIHNDSSMRISALSSPEIDVLPDDLETYENRVFQAVEDFCLSQNIESLKQEPQNVFTACLMYVNRQVFKRDKPGINNQKSVLNLDDVELLSGIADIYIYLATVNNKSCSVQDFCRLIGLDYQTVYNWKSDSINNILSQKRFEIFKRITGTREETLSNMLQTAKSPVGILGILNRQFAWNLPGVSREEATPKLTRNELLQGLDALPGKESSQIPLPMQDSQEND